MANYNKKSFSDTIQENLIVLWELRNTIVDVINHSYH